MSIYEKSYAKINLCLDVTEKLARRHHSVAASCSSIDFYDSSK
jgi:4-diphosphocytidyl-2C-methyl-D-erythritol kinase